MSSLLSSSLILTTLNNHRYHLNFDNLSREAIIELTEKEKIQQQDWKDIAKRVVANVLVVMR